MTDTRTALPAEVNQRFILARQAVTTALEGLGPADGMGTPDQYRALVTARRRVAEVYREAREIAHESELDQTLWFALDEAALWQDQEADRYRQLAAPTP